MKNFPPPVTTADVKKRRKITRRYIEAKRRAKLYRCGRYLRGCSTVTLSVAQSRRFSLSPSFSVRGYYEGEPEYIYLRELCIIYDARAITTVNYSPARCLIYCDTVHPPPSFFTDTHTRTQWKVNS